jgi:hypothetical protein
MAIAPAIQQTLLMEVTNFIDSYHGMTSFDWVIACATK